MSESTVYSLHAVLSLRRSTNFIYPSWSPHLTSHQDNGSVVRFSKQALLQIVTHQRQTWNSLSGAATGQTSLGRGHTWPLPAEAGLSTSILNF